MRQYGTRSLNRSRRDLPGQFLIVPPVSETYLRNTTDQERLSSLALINIEKDYQIDTDEIATDFVSKKDERKRIF